VSCLSELLVVSVHFIELVKHMLLLFHCSAHLMMTDPHLLGLSEHIGHILLHEESALDLNVELVVELLFLLDDQVDVGSSSHKW
jgi:hypothetical protein